MYLYKCFIVVILFFISNAAFPNEAGSSDHGECYQYITEMVRSSNFKFEYVKKEKVNILIDDDAGNEVTAQVFYDTNGTGTIGWITYKVDQHELYNTSTDLDFPVKLKFNKNFSNMYEQCIKSK
jgi:hypothetical protein